MAIRNMPIPQRTSSKVAAVQAAVQAKVGGMPKVKMPQMPMKTKPVMPKKPMMAAKGAMKMAKSAVRNVRKGRVYSPRMK